MSSGLCVVSPNICLRRVLVSFSKAMIWLTNKSKILFVRLGSWSSSRTVLTELSWNRNVFRSSLFDIGLIINILIASSILTNSLTTRVCKTQLCWALRCNFSGIVSCHCSSASRLYGSFLSISFRCLRSAGLSRLGAGWDRGRGGFF